MLRTVLRPQLYLRSSVHFRQFATSDAASTQFNVFAKMSDGVGVDSVKADTSEKKRPPSKRVLELVDQILNLSLIEAADLCDVCQERLSERTGGIPMRAPFPHPGAMFGMGGVPMAAPSGFVPQGVPAAAPTSPDPSASTATPKETQKSAEPAAEEAKSIVSVKLVSYPADKRVGVIKEIRAITGLGLKESKELVESVPKVIKRGLPREEAEELRKKLEGAGGVVEFS